jgi:alpha-L-rhamnosidase
MTLLNTKTLLTSLLLLSFHVLDANAQADQYPRLSAQKTAAENVLSPDPLIAYTWPAPKATDGLERYDLQAMSWHTSDPKSFKTKNFKKSGSITISGTGSLRFDFGRVSAGWLEFEADDMPDSISMSISEYNEPAIVNAGAVNPVKTLAPVKHGNIYRLELNPELYEGVRFGWLHVHSHRRSWRLKNLRLVCQTKPVNYQGSFSCSDPELTKIWYTGAYTVKLNLQKDYFGAILMERSDRHSWTGDAYPSQAAAMVAFGNYDFVKANLINTSGLNNGIASYSLYWVLSLIDYFNYTGDTDFVNKYIANAGAKLDLAYKHFGQSPSLGFYGWDERLGAGFENPDITESQRAYSMLSIRVWTEFGNLMQQIGNTELAGKYKTYAAEKLAEIRKEGSWLQNYGLHAAADAINTGLTDQQENKILYANNFTDRINRLSYSPFNQYFVINAMSRTGNYPDALSSIKDFWGGQLRQGATTFYEVYRPSWNEILGKNGAPPNNQCGYTSLTHPWSSGVVKWISEEILGIKPLIPGFKTFEIVPHTGGLLTSIAGSIYTPSGLITASFDVKQGLTTLTIPAGTKAGKVAVPLGGNIFKAINIHRTDHINTAQTSSVAYRFQREGDYMMLYDLPAGTYEVKITYTKKRKMKPAALDSWNYKILTFNQDSLTAANWKTKYGKDGHILFNYSKSGEHQQELPDYLNPITLKNQADFHMDGFGAIITKDPNPTQQTMTIDLPAKDDQQHQVALYFLDFDRKSRRTAVEVFDMNTLKLLSPVQMIREHTKGKYLVFNYKGSIRIRIDQVRGKNAALSGIFFDPAK